MKRLMSEEEERQIPPQDFTKVSEPMPNTSIKCKKCNSELGGLGKRGAFICLLVQGDEESCHYFLCKTCNTYTEWICITNFFSDEDTMFSRGPVSREEGEKIIEKIGKCPNPSDKWCRYPTHEELSQ